jgi:DNA-binding transcriptional regulator/RsmH inhibitor MraZ
MSAGRPPAWNPFVSLDQRAWTEVVGMSSKDRLTLPSIVRGRLSWFGDAVGGGLLAVLEADGSAELLPWSGTGEGIVEDVRGRIAAEPTDRRGGLVVAAMDRFVKVAVEQPARVSLPVNLASHLEVDAAGVVRVVAHSDRLWLWSERRWNAGRAVRLEALAG